MRPEALPVAAVESSSTGGWPDAAGWKMICEVWLSAGLLGAILPTDAVVSTDAAVCTVY